MKMDRRVFVKGAAALGATLAIAPSVTSAFADEEVTEGENPELETGPGPVVEEALQIFAANSLEKALPEVQALYTEQTGVEFADSQFKASGDLVEQLKAGAIVDILITASKSTMDDAEEAELIDPETRITMFNNDLVIVAAEDSDVTIESLEDILGDEITAIAIGEPSSVPAGKYACQSLYSIGLYSDESGADGDFAEEIADKVILADKVGTCASYVSTGDATIGFVYSSDVFRYDGIQIVYTVPADAHKDIIYPGAVCTDAPNADAALAFLDFCMTDPDALDIWSEFGFEVAIEEEEASTVYIDGVYEAKYNGIGGKVPVTVTIEGGVIVSVEIGNNSETQGIGSIAIEQLPPLIVAANGTEGVDKVAGASVTSSAIFKGVNDCLEQATPSSGEEEEEADA